MEIEPSAQLKDLARSIATKLNRGFYDSIYLSLAIVRKGVLVTAELRLYRALQGTPFADYIRWIEDGVPRSESGRVRGIPANEVAAKVEELLDKRCIAERKRKSN